MGALEVEGSDKVTGNSFSVAAGMTLTTLVEAKKSDVEAVLSELGIVFGMEELLAV